MLLTNNLRLKQETWRFELGLISMKEYIEYLQNLILDLEMQNSENLQ